MTSGRRGCKHVHDSTKKALVQLYLKKWWWPVASPGFCVRGHDDRGAEGASIEVPKAPSRGRVSAPQPTKGLGERHELPQAGSGAEPRPLSHFLHILGHRTLLVARKIWFSCQKYPFHFEKVVVTVTTTFKSDGDKSPSSHTKFNCAYARKSIISFISKITVCWQKPNNLWLSDCSFQFWTY